MASLNYAESRQEVGVVSKSLLSEAYQCYADALDTDDSGLLEQSADLALEAWQKDQQYLPGINLLARIALHRNLLNDAEQWVQRGLNIKADSASLLYSAGHISLAKHDLTQAESYFEQACRISRVNTKAPAYLAHIKLLKGEYVDAFQQYRELIKTNLDDLQIKNKLFESSNHIIADFYSSELEADLLRWFEFEDVNYNQLRSLATSLLKHKLQISKQGCPLEIQEIAEDPLLISALKKFYFCDPIIERLLMTLRQSILISSSQSLVLNHTYLKLVIALGQQCSLNESIWLISDQESQIVDQLIHLVTKTLELDALEPSDISAALLLILMCRPIHKTPFYAKIVSLKWQWPDPLNEFIHVELNLNEKLNQHRENIRSLGQIKNPSSKIVQQQYENYPYPRWTSLGYCQSSNYYQTLQSLFKNRLDDLDPKAKDIDVLVAGCGTGEHALRLSRYFKNLNITALDLSKSALAYGSIQAEKYGLTVNFIQADLLNIRKLPNQFDVIECSGVLHHMESPIHGLKALLGQLRPGGLIKLALYSRKARSLISSLRDTLGSNLPTDDKGIRQVRELLIKQDSDTWQPILKSPDFYSLSACRDLLFHELEHTYDLHEIQQMLESCGLEWVGIVPTAESKKLAKEYLNLSPEYLTINDWNTLEHLCPSLFSGMFQFYARKPK